MKELSSKLGFWIWCIVGGMFLILMIVLGALAVYGGIKDFVLADASQNWPSTTGLVVSSSIKRSSGTSSTVSYAADIKYEYTVNGRIFINSDISYGELYSSESEAQSIADRYPVDKTITVFYSSDDPDQSVLEPGLPGGGSMLAIAAGSFFLFTGLGLVFLFYWGWKSGKFS